MAYLIDVVPYPGGHRHPKDKDHVLPGNAAHTDAALKNSVPTSALGTKAAQGFKSSLTV